MPVAIRPHVFSLYPLDEETIALAERSFRITCPGDEGHELWYTKADGIMVRSQRVTPEDVAKIGPQLKFLGKHGVGVDAIDVKGLSAKGVVVTNTPGVNATAVAELALTLALAVARNVPFIDREIRAGKTITKQAGGEGGMQLTGRTLGLIGGGNIGFTLGKMFHGAFGAKIIVYDPHLSPAMESAWTAAIPSYRRVTSLDDLLPASDVVSVHVPLFDSTRDMIGARELRLMKRSAVLINTARGGIVNEEALAQALDEGVILGAGLDAFSTEPPTLAQFSSLINHPRVVSTPHIGAASLDVISQTAKSVVEHLRDAFAGNIRDEVKL
ncbi:uncharacterized protein MKK02DRAFT_23280 [Dioszegia hungarica]|uniref:D-3-phosphoglycerate dehydrogenase n=1 Tax=Dioszegia hungarica TaxID=4972 RepID=A0AA38HB09_9TREE|nr:uncharacterized protein MKK02DRAFT_23280 [Dioszegia hungarica]KAI9637763.1 hypothetical protein MKK02DRAFT_23280 [Dioszegia hungarica]